MDQKCKDCRWFQPFMFYTVIADWKKAVQGLSTDNKYHVQTEKAVVRGVGKRVHFGMCEEDNSPWHKVLLSDEHESCIHISQW